jgi:hypothetical protein
MKIRLLYMVDSLVKVPEEKFIFLTNAGELVHRIYNRDCTETETQAFSESFETIDDACAYFKIKVMDTPGLRDPRIIVSFPL